MGAELDLPMFRRGKVRDTFVLGEHLLMVATDRISAFDSVLPDGIPGKGKVLNQLSAWWFQRTGGLVENHMISTDLKDLDNRLKPHLAALEGRSMLVRRADRVDIECVVRGFLAGSAWAEYQQSGTVAGEPLPRGLVKAEELQTPIFSPATKEADGHDRNISHPELVEMIGAQLASQLKETSLRLYQLARKVVRQAGILLVDTKFEFGFIDGRLVLIDEALTPDSSRYWEAAAYRPGADQHSLDKQPVRDYLDQFGWDRQPPAPRLPPAVVLGTAARYREVFQRITQVAVP